MQRLPQVSIKFLINLDGDVVIDVEALKRDK